MPILNIERTINNVKFTPQADGSVLVNGTNNTVNYAVYVLTFNTAEYNVYRTVPAVAGTYYISNEGTIPSGVYVQCFTQITGQSVIQHNADGVFTVAEGFNFGCAIRVDAGTTVNNLIVKPMVEKNSAKTSWEPYVGSTSSAITPSPNPNYPQAVNVVTGAQTVKITGKNLCYSANRVSNTTLEFFCECATIKSPNVALSFITDFTTPGNASVYSFIDGVDLHTTVGLIATTAGQRSATTLDLTAIMSQIKDGTTLRLMVYRGGSTFTSVSDAQIELGSATAYEPYQGQSYAISFGNTYLAKIGDYADEPVKVDGTWYIRRAIGKVVLDGTEAGWGIFSNNNAFYSRAYDAQIPSPMTTVGAIMANYYTADSESNIYNARVDYGIGISSQNRFLIRNKDITTVANLKTWLGTHNTTVYYALATPIDTEITDSELIAQLNHIYELYQGTNNLWLIPSAGAQGEMTVRFGVAYDDDGSGYHWSEELGSPDNIISNDGIDSVRPIWIINGPATNPSLTNITTAQTITWNGTVPADSTLTIDMERQTATLNGANVYAQIEGDWLELAVGPNKLQYTASGGATADSTLEWNGVAG